MKHHSKELITRAAAFFKVVGDETRMKILCAISTDELCVNDIAFTHIEHKSHGENCCCNSCCSSCAGGRDPHHE